VGNISRPRFVVGVLSKYVAEGKKRIDSFDPRV
jgi:hypothetical protein